MTGVLARQAPANGTTTSADRTRRERVVSWLPALVTAAGFGVIGWRRMVFAADDFTQFQQVQWYGMSRQLLTFPLFQHVAPLNRTAHWVAFSVAPLNERVGFAVLFAAYLWFLLAFYAFAGTVCPTPARRAVAGAVAGLAVPVIDTLSWFDTAFQWCTFLGGLFTFLTVHRRYVAAPTVRRGALVLAALALTAVADVRFVLAVPVAILVDACLTGDGLTAASVRAVASRWRSYGLLLAGTVALALVEAHRYPPPAVPVSRTRTTLQIIWEAGTSFVPTRVLGEFRSEPFGYPVAALVAAAVVAAAVLLVRRDRRNLGPLLFAALCFLGSYALLWNSDLLGAGAEFNAKRSDYMLPTVLFGCLALTRVRWPRAAAPPAGPAARPGRRQAPGPAFAVAAALLLVAASRFVGSGVLISGLISPPPHYLDAVRAAAAQLAAHPADTLVELQAPDGLVAVWDPAQGHHRKLLQLARPQLGDRPLGHPVYLDATGALHPAALVPVSAAAPGGCAPATAAGSTEVRFDRPVGGNPLHLRLSITAARPQALLVTPLLGHDAWPGAALTVQPGTHDWLVAAFADRLDAVRVSAADGGPAPCLSGAAVVQAAAPEPNGLCALLAPDGAPGGSVPCRGNPAGS